jgi:glucose-6-phosphate isomerase
VNPFATGLDLSIDATLDFHYGPGTRGPEPELRTLNEIRASPMNPQCEGPSPVYSIAMDERREDGEADLKARYLLFGAVAYAEGRASQCGRPGRMKCPA